MSAICGAVGKYEESLVQELALSIRGKYQVLDFHEGKGVTVVGLHDPGESNIAQDNTGTIFAAVAGDVLVTPSKGSQGGWGPSAIADAWSVEGASVPDRTEGAFVSLVCDSDHERCFAFNDFIGQGALYYTHYHGATYFSSRLAPFLLSDGLPPTISWRGMRLYLTFRCVPGRQTILSGTKKILPGSLALIGPDEVRSRKYWRIGNIQTDLTTSSDEFTDRFVAMMDGSVQSRLSRSGGQIGLLLGGLDSSVVAAFMRRNTSERIVALTASFEDPNFNERGVRQVSTMLGLDLKEVAVDEERWPDIIEDMAEAYDEPVSDMIASPIAFALVKRSKGQVESFFDGTGGDDLFHGIPHDIGKLGMFADQIPDQIRVGLGSVLGGVYHGAGSSDRVPAAALRLLVTPAERELNSWRTIEESQVNRLMKKEGSLGRVEPASDLLKPLVGDISSDLRGMKRDPANFSVSTAVSLYFAPVHGYDCCRDRALSNEYGVSMVSPYHDRRLYDLALSVPWQRSMPIRGLTKPLLRRIAIRKKLLPPDVVFLTKMGLGSSSRSMTETYMGNWVKSQLSGWISDTLADDFGPVADLIDRDQVKRIVMGGRVRQAFLIVMFVLWYKRYFGARGVTPLRSATE